MLPVAHHCEFAKRSIVGVHTNLDVIKATMATCHLQ
jgi:hypothetical protein